MSKYQYRLLSEGLINHYLNTGRKRALQKAKEEFKQEKEELINEGFRLCRYLRDDSQNRVYEYRKLMKSPDRCLFFA